MGHITMPENALVGPPVKDNQTMEPADLAQCQSPFARWEGIPLPSSATAVRAAEETTMVHAAYKSPFPSQSQFVPVQSPWLMMMPVVAEPQQQQVDMDLVNWNLAPQFQPEHDDTQQHSSRSSSAHGYSDSDRGQGEVEALSSTGQRMSASMARRRRRQRAATNAYNQCKSGPSPADTCVLQSNAAEGARLHAKEHNDLMTRLEAAGDELSLAVATMRGSVRRLTFDAAGCRAVQKALEVADRQDAADLVAELHGCARRAITSPHGNYVIQKVIEAMPISQSRFIIAELTGAVGEFARHRYGCRIMCRLVEQSGTDPLTVGLTDEILQEVGELSRHSYGHHVIESVLEHGAMEQKHKIAAALHAELFHNATDRHATYVIESALRHCSNADRNQLVSAFLSDKGQLLWLAEHPSGFHVVKGLLKYSGQRLAIASVLEAASGQLQTTGPGNRVLEALRPRAIRALM